MAQISASLVKQLRDKTGAGMGACKNALVETEGDIEKAVDVLRAKGIKASTAARSTANGAVMMLASGDNKTVAIVELRCETDFAANSDNFQKLIKEVAQAVLEHKPASLDEAKALDPISKGIQEAVAMVIKENIVLSRADYKALEGDGRIGTYVHHNKQIGVAIAANTPADVAGKPELEQLLKDLAMHATAHHPPPVGVDRDSIPQDLVEREKAIALQAIQEDPKNASKPDNIKEKMVTGKLRKFFEERALLDQKFVRNPEFKIGKLLEQKGKELGGDISIPWFVRLKVGE